MSLADWHAGGTFVELGGERVFARISGPDDGRGAVVLLHGLPTSSYDYLPLIAALSDRYRCVCFDFLGFGASSKPDRPYTYEQQYDALFAVLRHAGVGDAYVVSHDYGGSVAQELLARMVDARMPGATPPALKVRGAVFFNAGLNPALHRPRLIQRVLRGPLGPWVGPWVTTKGTFQRSLAAVLARPERMDFDAHWTALEQGGGARIAHRLMHYMAERVQHADRWRDALARASVPLAFAWGKADPVSGAHVLPWIRTVAPRADVLELDVGHYPHTEAPDEVNAFVGRVLDAWRAREIGVG